MIIIICTASASKRMKIILLSSARCNGTVILRHFGQIPNSKIANERATRYYNEEGETGYVDCYQHTESRHLQQIKDLIQESNNSEIFISHEQAGDFTVEELQFLRNDGFIIVACIRHLSRQINSLFRLSDNKEFRDNIIRIGVRNMVEFYRLGLIDHILISEQYLSEPEYREQIWKEIGLIDYISYAVSTGPMTRFLGAKFHRNCTITGNPKGFPKPLNNPWNGPSACSLYLLPDTGNITINDDSYKQEYEAMSIFYS